MAKIIGLKKADLILIFGVLTFCVLLFLPHSVTSSKLVASIKFNGEVMETIKLDEIDDEYIIDVNGCEILVQNNAISFKSSNCHDQLCVGYGRLEKEGELMACVPNKVVIEVEESDDIDYHMVAH